MKKMISVLLLCMGLFSPLLAETIYSVDFSKPFINITDNIDQVDVGHNTIYNNYYGNSWLLYSPGNSYIEITFTKTPEVTGIPTLIISHLHSLHNGYGYSPINVYINDKRFLDHYDPMFGYYTDDTFSLGTEIKDGVNKIKITFCKEGYTNYWINKLSIEFKEQ